MKTYIASILFLLASCSAFAQEDSRIYIVIDGIPATDEAYEKVQSDTTAEMHFLPASKAVPLYGPVAAKGALLITTRNARQSQNPVFLLEGRRIDQDSINYSDIRRIDVIRGQQALNLYGPAAKDGVYLLHREKNTPVNVILRLVDERGNPVRRGKVISENGSILAESDKCGWIMLENFSLGNTVTISAGKKKLTSLVINRQVMKIKI